MEIEVNKGINKFNALAYAVSKLGPPREVGNKDRILEVTDGFVGDVHRWALPEGRRWLAVHEWSDGNQSSASGAYGHQYGFAVVRKNDDGSLCPDYEEQARGLIDAYHQERLGRQRALARFKNEGE